MATPLPQEVPPDFDIPDISLDPTTPSPTWSRGDIAFLVLGIPVYLAVVVEWLAWLVSTSRTDAQIVGLPTNEDFELWIAFYYCFYHCGIKAFRSKNYAKVLLTIIMTFVFTVTRLFFIPILIVSLPMPAIIRAKIPGSWSSYLQSIAFYAFIILLLIPAIVTIYNIFTKPTGRIGRYASILTDDAPKVCIIMPCYNEAAENVIKCINSIACQDYPMTCIHVCLSFDSDEVSKEYLEILQCLGVSTARKRKYPISLDIRYQGMRVTVSRYKHGGKRHTQKKTFQMIDKLYEKYLERRDDVFLLLVDSDCNLDKYAIQNFMFEMDFIPRESGGTKPLAMTGIITSRTDKNSFITLLQDIEYLHGQLFERAVESKLGACTCLPGALTCLRFSAFRNMAPYYFADMTDRHDNPFDFGQYHLGEDRFLTHLFMIGARYSHQIGFSTSTFCKTDACATWAALLKQRTRWFKGFITNEAVMLTDWILWKRYPLVCLYRLLQNTIRTTALLMALMILSLMTTIQIVENLPWPLIVLSLGANWLFMFWYGLTLNRKKAWLYPILFMANPLINFVYLMVSVWTFRERSWGGPRVRKGHQLVQTEEDEEESDGLPELSERERDAIREAALPWRTLSGRFVPAQVNEDGLYHRSELHLPMSGRSSVVLPQLLNSDAASTSSGNGDGGSTGLLSPPLPDRRNRNSAYSNISYDSEVGRLYAPAQNFLRVDQLSDEERLTQASNHIEDYGVRLPVPMENSASGSDSSDITSSGQHGDIGAMSLLHVHSELDDGTPHAISDNTPGPHGVRSSVQYSINMLFPEDLPRSRKRSGSADSWSHDDDAAFTAGENRVSPTITNSATQSDTATAESVGQQSASRKPGKLIKRKPIQSMEVDDSATPPKGKFFGLFKKS